MKIKGHEIAISIAVYILSLALFIGAYFIGSQYWQSLTIGLGTTALGLAVALTVVNVYLSQKEKKKAIKSLLMLVAPSIQKHHNDLLEKAWDKLGKPQFGELVDRYKENNGDPRALSPEERTSIYEIVKTNKSELDVSLNKLDSELKELSFILGWSFDPKILSASFKCRFAIQQFLALEMNDEKQTILDACESYLDADIQAFNVFGLLVVYLGMSGKDVQE